MKPSIVGSLERMHAKHARVYRKHVGGTLSILSGDLDSKYWYDAERYIKDEKAIESVINFCIEKYDDIPMCRHALQDIHYLVDNWFRLIRKMNELIYPKRTSRRFEDDGLYK